MIRSIMNYSMQDVKDSLIYLLDKAAHSQEVRSFAISITQDSQDKISAIYNFMKDNVAYIPDPVGPNGNDIELFISPVVMVSMHEKGITPSGDCDDMALLGTALFRAIGMKSNIVLVDSGGGGIDHAFSEVWSDKLGKWIDFDVTVKEPLGWSRPYHKRITV